MIASNFLNILWDYIIASAPFLLLGLFVAGLIHVFLPKDFLKRNLGSEKGVGSIIKASLIGIPLPLCSCAVIPTAVSLRKGGASNASTSAFLISTPESGVDSIAMTYGMMDFPMTIIRPVAAFFSAFIAGVFQLIFNNYEIKEEEESKPKSCCAKTNSSSIKNEKNFVKKLKESVEYGLFELLEDLAAWLAFGLVLGALITMLVPDDFFSTIAGWQAKFLILLVGIPLYICASATTPIAAGLILKGMSPGTALLILLVGPATNAANIAVLQKYIGKKGVIINVLCIAGVALIFSFLTDFLYETFSWPMLMNVTEKMHESEGGMAFQVMAVIFTLLLLKALYKAEIKPRLSKTSSSEGCH